MSLIVLGDAVLNLTGFAVLAVGLSSNVLQLSINATASLSLRRVAGVHNFWTWLKQTISAALKRRYVPMDAARFPLNSTGSAAMTPVLLLLPTAPLRGRRPSWWRWPRGTPCPGGGCPESNWIKNCSRVYLVNCIISKKHELWFYKSKHSLLTPMFYWTFSLVPNFLMK